MERECIKSVMAVNRVGGRGGRLESQRKVAKVRAR